MKKFLSLVLVLAIVLSAVSFASAEAAATSGSFIILHTNDIHGHAVTDSDYFGYARISALKKSLQNAGKSVLLFDAGDFTQGMPIVNVSYGRTAIDFMNAVGYDAVCPGNHEFDWGADNLLQNAEAANFPVLAANILRSSDSEPVFTANTIFDIDGFKVGVFGLDTPECKTKVHPDKVKGIDFLAEAELYACAQAQVDTLKAEGCDMIVCLGHLGDDDESIPNRSIDVINNTQGIDLFIDAHSHTEIDGGDTLNNTMRTSTGSYSENIGYVAVDWTKDADNTTIAMNVGLYDAEADFEAAMATGSGLAIDEEVAELVNSVDASVTAELSVPFASTTVFLNGERDPGNRTEETNLGDFSCDAILWAARQSYSENVVAAITNGGGIRASINVGDISMLDMKTVFPFGNTVAVLTVTGSELLEVLEAGTYTTPTALGAFPQVSGIEFTVDTTNEWVAGDQYPDSTYFAPANPGNRVTITSVGGQPFDMDAEYMIATNDFSAAGGDTYYAFKYAFATAGVNTGLAIEDALIQYTQNVLNGVVGEQYAEPQGRITIIK